MISRFVQSMNINAFYFVPNSGDYFSYAQRILFLLFLIILRVILFPNKNVNSSNKNIWHFTKVIYSKSVLRTREQDTVNYTSFVGLIPPMNDFIL